MELTGTKVANLVKEVAQKTHSRALMQLANNIRSLVRSGIQTGEDPFAKVKGLIKDMIEKLLKEAEEEAGHKAYCDEEMAETKEKKEELTTEIEELTTKIDKMTAEAAKLREEV